MADAAASFELSDDSLSAGLSSIAAKFEAIAAQINTGFASANAQLAGTAAATQRIGATAPAITALGSGLQAAAVAGQLVATAFSGITSAAVRLAPFVRFVPDTLGRWVPPLKSAAAQFVQITSGIGAAVNTARALSGQLSVVNAAFLGMELRELGASRAMAVLGATGAFATSKIVAGARMAAGAVASIGSGAFGAIGRLGSSVGGMFGALGRQAATVTTLFAPMAGLALALGPVGAAAIGVAGAFGVMGKSISAAAETQSMQASFVTLLGSMDAAQSRMRELSQFAAQTPFEIPQVVRASRVLETLTRGALSTGAGLRMVGDIASVSGQPIEELAVHVGRLYDGMMNGRPVGESLMRLQELGLVSAQTRGRLEDLQKAGARGNSVWSVAAQDLMRFSGEMNRQSSTWSGIMSNFSDSVGNVFRAIGAPLITALSPFMTRVNAWLGSLIPMAQRFGAVVAGWGALAAQIFADGKMGEALGLVARIGFGEAVNFLAGALVGVGNAFATIMGGAIRSLLVLLSHATTADFWKGLGNALLAAAELMIVTLLNGVAKVLDALRDVPGIGDRAGQAADQARGLAGSMADASVARGAAAADQLAPLFNDFVANFQRTMADAVQAFQQGRANTGALFNTDSDRAALTDLVQKSARAAQTAIDKASAALSKGGLPAAPSETAAQTSNPAKDRMEVSALQKLALGGFANGGRDPLLTTANAQLAETRGLRIDVQKLTQATANTSKGTPVFA